MNMQIESIIIADIQKNECTKKEFQSGINIVTSTGNHVGKSSLIKSIYYSLGAECYFDNAWGKSSKLCITSFFCGAQNYTIARLGKNFCLTSGNEIIIATDKVTDDLTPALENIFQFSIHAKEKKKDSYRTSPLLIYLPYYIDQDLGWSSEPFFSFSNTQQFDKKDRLRSLYHHLGVADVSLSEKEIELTNIKRKRTQLSTEMSNISALLKLLTEQVSSMPTLAEQANKNRFQSVIMEDLETLISQLEESRIKLQNYETEKLQYNRQLQTVDEYEKLRRKISPKEEVVDLIQCPNCGFDLTDNMETILRKHYSEENQDFVRTQLQFLIDRADKNIEQARREYARVSEKINLEEQKIEKNNATELTSIKTIGLTETVHDLEEKYNQKLKIDHELEEQAKKITSEIRKQSKKQKAADERFALCVKDAMLSLGIWEEEYEGNIGIMKTVSAQGSASSKSILAHHVGFFGAQNALESSVTKFPFIVDSPRTKEASVVSGFEILSSIARVKDLLPQIVIATVDYTQYEKDLDWNDANIIELSKPKSLLSQEEYKENEETIRYYKKLLLMA